MRRFRFLTFTGGTKPSTPCSQRTEPSSARLTAKLADGPRIRVTADRSEAACTWPIISRVIPGCLRSRAIISAPSDISTCVGSGRGWTPVSGCTLNDAHPYKSSLDRDNLYLGADRRNQGFYVVDGSFNSELAA